MIANASRTTVFVDLSPLAADGSNGGAASFVLGLLTRLAPRLDLHLMVKRCAEGAVAPVLEAGARLHVLGTDVREPRRVKRTVRRSPLGPVLPDGASLRRRGARVLFSPLLTASFHEPGLRHVAIAFDFQELWRPDFFDAHERRRRAAFRADLRRCDKVVAISSFTCRDSVARAGLDPARLEVVPPIVARCEALPEARAGTLLSHHGLAPGGYAIYPANFWPHKNHDRLLEAAALAPSVRLVLCGALDEGRARAEARARELGIAGRVSVLPYVADDERTALLQSARFLVFPSLFEGFGIPVFEAFQLGVPVACARIPALAELAEGAALLFDPDDPNAIAGAMETLWADAPERNRLAASGRACAAGIDPEAIVARWAEILAE